MVERRRNPSYAPQTGQLYRLYDKQLKNKLKRFTATRNIPEHCKTDLAAHRPRGLFLLDRLRCYATVIDG
jgi:hypothetical protein